jgi:hypothetical protein
LQPSFQILYFPHFQINTTNANKRHNRKEAKDVKMALYPYFQAENDLIIHREIQEQLKKDAETMKHNPHWKGLDQKYHNQWNDPTKSN